MIEFSVAGRFLYLDAFCLKPQQQLLDAVLVIANLGTSQEVL